MEIGVDSFVAATIDRKTGQAIQPARHLGELLEAITLADEVGLDVFGIGEHHRPEFLDSAPAVILAAAASRTKRIRLISAVTVPQRRRSGAVISRICDPRSALQWQSGNGRWSRLIH